MARRRGRILRGVCEHRGVSETVRVECAAHRGDLAVHHSAEPEQLRAGFGLSERHLPVAHERGVVVDGSARIEHPAVPVIGELVEAQVGLHDETVTHLLDGDARRDVEYPVGIGRAGSGRVLGERHAEEHDTAHSRGGGIHQCAAERIE